MEHEVMRLEREISDVRSGQSAIAEQLKHVNERLDHQDKVLDTLNELALSVRDLTHAQAATNERVDNLCEDMDEIKAKPAKRWNSIVSKAIDVVVGALLMYLLVKLGLA